MAFQNLGPPYRSILILIKEASAVVQLKESESGAEVIGLKGRKDPGRFKKQWTGMRSD